MSALAHAPVFWDLNGIDPERAGIYITGRSVTGARMRAFWPCKDGWINFIVYGGVAGRHTNEQLVAWMDERGFWQEVGSDRPGGAIRYPGGFAFVDGTRLPIRRPAPEVGEHNDEVYGELEAASSRTDANA